MIKNFMAKSDLDLMPQRLSSKMCFVGISLGFTTMMETGIAIINRNLDLQRIDKIFNINELQDYLKMVAPAESLVICVDLPKTTHIINDKWRQEAKNVNALKLGRLDCSKYEWTERFSNRGSELCNALKLLNIDVYRYNCYFTKNILNLNSPYKSRSPAACKHLQLSIKNNLKISGIPSNLIALSGLDALVGAYTGWRMALSQENIGYKFIGNHNKLPIVSAI